MSLKTKRLAEKSFDKLVIQSQQVVLKVSDGMTVLLLIADSKYPIGKKLIELVKKLSCRPQSFPVFIQSITDLYFRAKCTFENDHTFLLNQSPAPRKPSQNVGVQKCVQSRIKDICTYYMMSLFRLEQNVNSFVIGEFKKKRVLFIDATCETALACFPYSVIKDKFCNNLKLG